MRKTAIILFFILTLLPLRDSYAQSPAIDAGLGYLYATQNSDRSWGGEGGSTGTVASTVTVLQTLQQLSETDRYEYLGALSWLQARDLDTTEDLSERILTLTTGGADSDKLLSYLDTLMNAWGGYNDYGVSIIDTVYAIRALKTITYSDATVFAAALDFLITNQNTDGSWGFYKGDAGNTYITSLVLRTLAELSPEFGVQSSVDEAAAYLLTRQNPDGGFGSSPSTIHETALAYEALVMSGADVSDSIPLAVGYLNQTQRANGSWNNEPYSTALALQALNNVKANLSVSSSDIAFSDTKLTTGERITITVVVKNTGMVAADQVTVHVYDNDPAKGTAPFYSQIIGSIASGGTVTLSVPYTVSGNGSHSCVVWIDPHNKVAEVTKADNIASKSFWAATWPDVAVFAEDISPSTSSPAPGAPFDISFKIRNLGETEAYPVNTALYDVDPAAGGTPIAYGMVTTVKPGEVRGNVIIGAVLNMTGVHTLYIVANYDDQVQESTKSNNTASFTVNVGGAAPTVDLSLASSDLTVTPRRPLNGETVQIAAIVRNLGQSPAYNFTVDLYDGDPAAQGGLIASQTLSLAAGAEQNVTTNWVIPSGIHTVYAVVDRVNTIAETNKFNNQASITVMVDMIDITLSATDLSFNPPHPVSGDSITLSITAHNAGIVQTGPFNLALYDGDPAAGGALLQTYPIANINGDGSTTVTYNFIASPQTYRFYAVADTENVVTEMYEDNNTAIRSLKIKAPGETLGPDLVPIKIDLTDTTNDPQTLAISGNAHVTFQNKGDNTITTPFNVIIFEDRDNDGHYTQGVDNLISTATNTLTIWPEGAGLVNLPLMGTVQFLHSPMYALVDSGDAVLEQDETNNLLISCKDCEVVPSNPIQPALTWKWRSGKMHCYDQVPSQPVIAPLIDTNGDGKIDKYDDPHIIFLTPDNGTCGGSALAAIHAVNGKTGQELFTIHGQGNLASLSNVGFAAGAHLAVGDINNDGLPEILVAKWSNYYWTGIGYATGLLAFKNDGSLLWDNALQVANWNLAHQYPATSRYQVTIGFTDPISIADIDADGLPDIVAGVAAFNGDGSIKWGYPSFYYYIRQGSPSWGSGGGFAEDYSVSVADIDLDGRQEVLAGKTVYNADGTIKWWNKDLTDGFSMAVNLNDDPYPEILHGSNSQFGTPGVRINLFDHTGEIIWGPVYVRNLEPTTPFVFTRNSFVIADFDGDGESEIGIKGHDNYFVLDRNGVNKNSVPMPWYSSPYIDALNMSAPAVFDLNGDGKPELMYNNGVTFKIQDARTGAVLYQEPFGGSSANFYSNVIVSDVDNDGHAELVVFGGSGGSSGFITPQEGLNVYRAQNNDWVGSRTISNELFYHVTNVNDDATIPQHEAPSWLLNNSYFVQSAIGPNPNPYLTPNLTASYLRVEQAGTSINLAVRVGNGGATASPASVLVTFYDGPSTGSGQVLGTVIGTASTTRTLNPGEYQDVIYSWTGGSLGLHHVYAVVDAANAVSECRKDDNQVNADFTIQVEYPDLRIGQEDIVLPTGPYYEGLPVSITANVRNIGAMPASNVVVRLYNGNPSTGGIQIGLDQTIPSINAGSNASVMFTYDTLGNSGANILYMVIDPANSIVESSKANNMASVTLMVQPPVLPDLAISATDIQLSPATLREGDTATLSATIHNLGTAVGNIPVRVSVRSGELGTGSEVSSETKTIYPILGLGQSATVQTTLDTAGLAGQQSIVVTIDPANAVAESREDNNSANQSFFVQSSGLNASITIDKTSYQADELVTATITAGDTTGSSRSLTLGLYVQDSAGNRIATISSADPVTINPNSSVTLSRTWNTGTTLSGAYNFTAEVAEEGSIISRVNTNFSIIPDKGLQAKATTDKISYNPNESVAITSVVTSQSRNYIMENLTARTRVMGQGSGEELYTETKTISTLMPGATFTFKDYWNTGTHAPGAYPVLLEVRDASGALITTGTATVTITNVIKPSAVLNGTISVDKQSLLSGETATVSYSVMNNGNIDLSNVTLSVLTVHVVNETVYDTLSSQATLSMGAAYAHTAVVDTADYTAKDYLVILRANIGGIEETLAGSYFRVEGAPTVPSLASPVMNADVETFTPTLSVNNASDPNDDKLTYEFELYSDSGLTQQVSSGVRSEESGVTSWIVPNTLTENATYYWRSRAYDGKLYGDWMSLASFRVNTVNDPPTAPTVSSPADNAVVDTLVPVLVVNNAFDPDSSSLTYNFDVALDPDYISIVSTTIGVISGPSTGSGGSTSWQVPFSLAENTTYYWRCQADDWLITGPWMTPAAKFFVNTANDAPSKPAVMAPLDNSEVTILSPEIVIANSTDPDSAVLTYFFEADIVPTFDSPDIIRSGGISAGQGTTTWQATGLQDNTQYYVHAKANDGQTDGPWSNESSPNVHSFFVNTANDPPTAPTLANPSNGAGVNTDTPTLSVHNATDPDKDVLTYDFEVYADEALTTIVTATSGVRSRESEGITSWSVPVSLNENQTYYWLSRAYDGTLYSEWTSTWSFMVNAANDAPGAPVLSTPMDGSSIATLTPTLAITNAVDPDSDTLTYTFEIYTGDVLVQSIPNVPQDSSGVTSITLTTALQDNTAYRWLARAYDGDRYGPPMVMATFTTHLPQTNISATINFDPNTLNKTSNGTWVVVYIELPAGYNVADIVMSSIRLEGTIPAETRPYAVGDYDKDGIPDLMVKFKRSEVINLLPNGEQVTVHVTGTVGTVIFDGVDIIRVIK